MTRADNPAFPEPLGNGTSLPGLTKRELFAAMAMQSIVSNEKLLGILNEMFSKEENKLLNMTDHVAHMALMQAESLIRKLKQIREDD